MVTLVTATGKRILEVMEHPWNQGLICLFQGCHETNLKGEAPMPHKRCPVTTLGSKPLETSLGFKTHYIMPIIDHDFRCLLEISACCRTVNCCKGLRRTCLVSFKDAIKPIPFPICAGSSLTCKEDVSRGNQLSRCIHITVSNPIGPMFCICSTNKRTNELTNKQNQATNRAIEQPESMAFWGWNYPTKRLFLCRHPPPPQSQQLAPPAPETHRTNGNQARINHLRSPSKKLHQQRSKINIPTDFKNSVSVPVACHVTTLLHLNLRVHNSTSIIHYT